MHILLLFLISFILIGCGEDAQVRRYQAPREASAPAQDLHAGIHWHHVPENWVKENIPGRVASFKISEADQEGTIAVTRFQMQAVSLLANVNRWRGQMNLPALEQAADIESQTHQSNAGPFTLVQIHNPESKEQASIAILENGPETWFFKFTGPETLITKHQTAFLNFLKGLEKDGSH